MEPGVRRNRSLHMANERTFLSWIRTSIGLMAFGFVVERFAIFIKQVGYFLQMSVASSGKAVPPLANSPTPGYSSILGIILVGLGALMGFLSLVRYKKIEKDIDEGRYEPSMMLDILLGMSILSVGVFLIFYLVHTL